MYQSLIFFLNRFCPVGCISCSAAATPGNRGSLQAQWLESFFRKVDTQPLDFSGYIVWTGGEPFLSFDSLETGVKLASLSGFHSEILTSGVWFGAHPEYLDRLEDAGNVSLRISLDAEHQDTVPVQRIVAMIKHSLEIGITVNFTLREIPGRSESPLESLEEIKRSLPEFVAVNEKRSRWIHYIPHVPIQTIGLPEPASIRICSDDEPDNPKGKRCRMAYRDLVIGADGMAYPCCGFFGLSFYPELALGDALEDSWEKLALGREGHTFKGPCHSCLDRHINARNSN